MTVGSLFLVAPALVKQERESILSGYVTVGESETGGTKCADIYDLGFYSCDEPLNGRYITFYATNPEDDASNYWNVETSKYELMLTNFKVFPSANLITTATLAEEPEPRATNGLGPETYSDYMYSLNPRSFNINSDVSPKNCMRYTENTGNFVLKMAEKTYVDYVIATGEPKDKNSSWYSAEYDDDETCTKLSNKLFSEGGHIYLSNTTSTIDAVDCGVLGSTGYINMPANADEFEDVTKVGGTL